MAEGTIAGTAGEELLREVEASGALPEGIRAEDAVSGVLDTLATRLTAGEAHGVEGQLPKDRKVLWMEGSEEAEALR